MCAHASRAGRPLGRAFPRAALFFCGPVVVLLLLPPRVLPLPLFLRRLRARLYVAFTSVSTCPSCLSVCLPAHLLYKGGQRANDSRADQLRALPDQGPAGDRPQRRRPDQHLRREDGRKRRTNAVSIVVAVSATTTILSLPVFLVASVVSRRFLCVDR